MDEKLQAIVDAAVKKALQEVREADRWKADILRARAEYEAALSVKSIPAGWHCPPGKKLFVLKGGK